MPEINETLGQRIKRLRIERNMSQEQLAERLGYKSRSSINKIELGINDITQTKVIEFAEVLMIMQYAALLVFLYGYIHHIGERPFNRFSPLTKRIARLRIVVCVV